MSSQSNSLKIESLQIQIPDRGPISFSGEVFAGERLALLGPSGCGKSTFLRTLCGLQDKHPSARIFLGSEPIAELAPHLRKISYLAQGPSLFPQFNAWENAALPLDYADESRSWSKELKKQRCLEIFSDLEISSLADKNTENLSGGEKQRVLLARSLIEVSRKNLFLWDEPFTGIDPANKAKIFKQIVARLQGAAGPQAPLIFVTHSHEDAELFATRTIQWPSPESSSPSLLQL